MQTVNPYLLYEDCDAALDFLARAFGFEEVLRYTGEGGYVNHAEMKVGAEGRIFMGDPGDQYKSPKRLGQETVGIYVYVDDDVDGRARPVPRSRKSRPTRSTASGASQPRIPRATSGTSRDRSSRSRPRSGERRSRARWS